ncbi:hypothetical protein ABEF95_016350 [Exophiala dermatitidis]
MPQPDKVMLIFKSRRFLPPSSSSANPSSVASARKHAFQSSHPQPSASTSPFYPTPRFHSVVRKEKDDIQTSFDDDDIVTPSVPKFHVSLPPQDSIEPEDDELGRISPLQSRNKISTPVTKRRKVSHAKSELGETITISSSPELVERQEDNHHEDEGLLGWEPGSDEDEEVAANTPGPNETISLTRFRPGPAPSAVAASLPRAVFKSVAEDAQPCSVGSGAVIPEVFSPSKRKGKRDYISGGNADIVRSWVLNVAAQESQATSTTEMIFVIQRVKKDRSGRFVIVFSDDGSSWLLPAQHQKGFADPKATLTGIIAGLRVLIKGHAMKWPLLFGTSMGDVRVAASWELIPAG